MQCHLDKRKKHKNRTQIERKKDRKMQGRGVNNISQLSLFLNSLQTTYVYLRVSAHKKLRYEKHV